MEKKKVKNKEEKKVEVVEKEKEVQKKSRTDYVFAILLLFIGTVLLLNTTGVIAWDIWTVLWRFWPVLIIFAGLNLIFEGSKALSVVLAIFSFIVFTMILLWSLAISGVSNVSERWNIHVPMWVERIGDNQGDINKTFLVFEDDYENVVGRNIDINMGIGSLQVRNDEIKDHVMLEAEYYRNFGKPELETELESDILDISMELGREDRFFSLGRISPKYFLTLGSDDIPTNFTLKQGAGKSDIRFNDYNLNVVDIDLGAGSAIARLSGMHVNDFKINVGAGKFQLELGEDFTVKRILNVKIGAGKMTIDLPDGMEYKIDTKLGVGSIETRDENISGIGNEPRIIRSEGYDFAENKIDIVADVGVGQLIIK